MFNIQAPQNQIKPRLAMYPRQTEANNGPLCIYAFFKLNLIFFGPNKQFDMTNLGVSAYTYNILLILICNTNFPVHTIKRHVTMSTISFHAIEYSNNYCAAQHQGLPFKSSMMAQLVPFYVNTPLLLQTMPLLTKEFYACFIFVR